MTSQGFGAALGAGTDPFPIDGLWNKALHAMLGRRDSAGACRRIALCRCGRCVVNKVGAEGIRPSIPVQLYGADGNDPAPAEWRGRRPLRNISQSCK